MLVQHYHKTGSPYTWFRDDYERYFPEMQQESFAKAAKRLQSDGILYRYLDRSVNDWKIGLRRSFLQTLAAAFQEV